MKWREICIEYIEKTRTIHFHHSIQFQSNNMKKKRAKQTKCVTDAVLFQLMCILYNHTVLSIQVEVRIEKRNSIDGVKSIAKFCLYQSTIE